MTDLPQSIFRPIEGGFIGVLKQAPLDWHYLQFKVMAISPGQVKSEACLGFYKMLRHGKGGEVQVIRHLVAVIIIAPRIRLVVIGSRYEATNALVELIAITDAIGITIRIKRIRFHINCGGISHAGYTVDLL